MYKRGYEGLRYVLLFVKYAPLILQLPLMSFICKLCTRICHLKALSTRFAASWKTYILRAHMQYFWAMRLQSPTQWSPLTSKIYRARIDNSLWESVDSHTRQTVNIS